MSALKAIEYLVEYKLSQGDLDQISDDQKATLAVISYATTEINTLRRLYLVSDHEPVGIEAIDYAITIQRSIILRTWSAKLFEFLEFLFPNNRGMGTKDTALTNLIASAKKSFDVLQRDPAYQFVRSVRHEASNHYSLKAARKNLGHTSKSSKLQLYLHQVTGNGYFPWGEEVMFVGRLNRQASQTSVDQASLLRSWMNWNLDATKWLDEVNDIFFRNLIIDKFPDRKASRRNYWIDPILVARTDERRTPIFLRKSAK